MKSGIFRSSAAALTALRGLACCLPWLGLVGLSACDKAKQLGVKVAESALKSGTATSTGSHSGPIVSEISEADFVAFIGREDRLIVVDFYADWCPPCRALSPLLEKTAAEHRGKVLVGKVNVDQAPNLSQQYGVRSIPDLRFFRNGKEVDRLIGLPPEAHLRTLLARHAESVPDLPAEPSVEKTGDAPAIEGNPQGVSPMSKDWLPPGVQRRGDAARPAKE